MDEKQIKEKIKLAETSISELGDQSLKEKAFEVVLSTLLQQPGTANTPVPMVEKPKARRVKSNLTKNSKKETSKSQLKLDETQLGELREFYDKFKPTGSELCVFILANFLRVKLNMQTFHEGDIKYCYDQLLALRTTTRPLALNFIQLKRAMSWLISPTRRKLWLENGDDGLYQVSSNGILKFKDLENELKTATTE